MWYENEAESFEIDLDRHRLHLTITTLCQVFGIFLSRGWSWEFDFKKVGWYFYLKVRFGFAFVGFEYLNYARSTYRKEAISHAIYRDMRFWKREKEQKDGQSVE